MTALGDFSAGDVLTAADLNAIGTWQTYTPAEYFWNLYNGTMEGRYCVLNKFVYFHVDITLGSSSTISTGMSVGGPSEANGVQYFGSLWYGDASSGAEYDGNLATFNASDRVRPFCFSGNNRGAISATFPFSYGAGDELHLWGAYEIL